MTKRKADIEDNLLLPSKVPKKFATDEEEDDDSDDGKKYEILKEDDIEGLLLTKICNYLNFIWNLKYTLFYIISMLINL